MFNICFHLNFLLYNQVIIFFNLYVNYIKSVFNKLFIILFADDTSLFIEGDNLYKLVDVLNNVLDKLYDWLCMNRLPILIANLNMQNDPIDNVKFLV